MPLPARLTRHRGGGGHVPLPEQRRRCAPRCHRGDSRRASRLRWSARPDRARPRSAAWWHASPIRPRDAISIGGVDLVDVAPDELRQRLVVVSQEPFLFDDSILANIGFARPKSTEAEIEAVIADLGATDWIDALDDGLATKVGERGEALSAGERQLIALIRAGLADPGRADPRRSHVVGRCIDRGAYRPSTRPPCGRSHDDRHRTPAVDCSARGSGPRAGRRRAGRGRDARRTRRRRSGPTAACTTPGSRRRRCRSGAFGQGSVGRPNGRGPLTEVTSHVELVEAEVLLDDE